MRYAALVTVVMLVCGLGGQCDSDYLAPREGPVMVAMAACKTTVCVKRAYARIRKPGLVARIVYFSRLLALRPRDSNAALDLLRNIPRTADENAELIILSMNMYPDETDAQIDAVGQAFWYYSRNLARALRLHPEFLPAFIRYGTIALSPHSHYPNWAARVCRSNPSRFLKAFETLSPKDRRYISEVVIQPKGCRQIAFPEAD